MSNAKIWAIVIGLLVGCLLLGWFVRADSVRSSRADILSRARAAKARKRKERAKGETTGTGTN